MQLKNPVIEKMLVISTAHVTPSDLEHFKQYGGAYYEHNMGFGMMAYTGGVIVNEWGKFTSEFKTIMEYARENGFTFVLFDRDGDEYEEFKKFDW